MIVATQTWKSSKPEKTGRAPRKVTEAAARRELEDLRAAINYHRMEGLCSEVVAVRLPKKPLPRTGWLTRSEAARLLWAAWRARQVMRDGLTKRSVGKHLARFILAALYTGTRSMAICEAALSPAVGRGWVDLDAGVFHRRAIGRRATNKRQPPVRLPPRLLVHMRRWRDLGISNGAVVEWNGKPVKSVKKAFRAAVEASGIAPAVSTRLGLPVDVVPHLLRHTAATWLMQAGVPTWEAAGFLGMTERQLIDTYGHHSPDFQAGAATAVRSRPRGPIVDRNTLNKRRLSAENG